MRVNIGKITIKLQSCLILMCCMDCHANNLRYRSKNTFLELGLAMNKFIACFLALPFFSFTAVATEENRGAEILENQDDYLIRINDVSEVRLKWAYKVVFKNGPKAFSKHMQDPWGAHEQIKGLLTKLRLEKPQYLIRGRQRRYEKSEEALLIIQKVFPTGRN